MGRILRKRVDHRATQLAWLHRIILEILHIKQTLDNRGARGFGAQTVLFHLLNETTLRIARRRLGLLGKKLKISNSQLIALRQRR